MCAEPAFYGVFVCVVVAVGSGSESPVNRVSTIVPELGLIERKVGAIFMCMGVQRTLVAAHSPPDSRADSAGTYVNSWSSLPFGDNQTALGTGVDATEHHFTGKEHDAESGLDSFKARYSPSQTGRWLLWDWSDTPIGYVYDAAGIRDAPTTKTCRRGLRRVADCPSSPP